MRALDFLEAMFRGNPDLEPAVHALRYMLVWVSVRLA